MAQVSLATSANVFGYPMKSNNFSSEPLTHVTASLFYQPPWVNYCAVEHLKGTTQGCQRPGLNVEMFLYLAQILNFTFDIKIAEGMGAPDQADHWGRSMLGYLHRNEADMSVNTVYHTFLRGQIVDYMNPNGLSKLGVLIPKPSGRLKTDTLLLPFGTGTWYFCAGITILTCVASVTALFVHQRFNEESAASPKLSTKIRKAIEISLAATVAKGRSPCLQDSSKLILISWQLVTGILTGLYSSLLFYEIAVTRPVIPFHSVGGLADKLQSGEFKALMPMGIDQFLSTMLTSSSSQSMVRLKKALQQNEKMVISDKERFRAPDMMNQNTLIIDIEYVLWTMASNNCSVVQINLEGMGGNFFSPVFSKKFGHVEKFNQWSELISSYYTRLEKLYSTNLFPAECDNGNMIKAFGLSMAHLWMTFQLYAIGATSSVLLHVIQWAPAEIQNRIQKKIVRIARIHNF